MFRQTFPAGVSWWFIGSRVVGSTPWAMTTLPWGAADATADDATTSAVRSDNIAATASGLTL